MNIKKYISRLSSNKFVIFLFHGVIKQEVSNIRNYNKKHILECSTTSKTTPEFLILKEFYKI